jgi:hypothetical protein
MVGLVQSPHDPCLFSGIVDPTTSKFDTSTNEDGTISVSIPHPTDPSAAPTSITLPAQRQMIHIGVYVDDFVFYSTNDAEEDLFRQVLQSQITVDFMGDVDYFLGSAFLWQRHSNGHVSVHLSQSAFTEHTAHRFGLDRFKRVPNMTPYRSGLPIDSLPSPAPMIRISNGLQKSTKVLSAPSIGWPSVLVPMFHLPSPSSLPTATLQAHNTIKRLSMSSNISTAQVITASPIIQMHATPSKLSITFLIITTKRHTLMPLHRPLPKLCNLHHSPTHAGVLNLAMHSHRVHLLSYLNSVRYLVMLFVVQGGLSPGALPVKNKWRKALAKLKFMPPMNVSRTQLR